MPHHPTLHIIATQHLDVAYLWPRQPDGEDLMLQCFARAVEMLDAQPEAGFRFSRSTAWSFDLLERRDPVLFARVRQAVADGRLELCGGQWVEPDNILPDGESLVRQALYGQRYYLDTFGRAARVSWNPDAFAHGHTLPQLFCRAGLEAYYFHRCVPTDADGHLVDRFLWEGLDGSRVLVLAGHWRGRPDGEVVAELAADLARSGSAVGFAATGANSDRRVTMEVDWVPLLPRRDAAGDARWATAGEVVDALAAAGDQLPVLRGELGWQFTGTYTTEGRIKRRNRRLEVLLDTVERLWAGLWAGDAGAAYPGPDLCRLRRDLCVNQFHDIVCGTCYQYVHEEAFELYDAIEAGARQLLGAGMARAATATRSAADRQTESDRETRLLYNPLGQAHRSPVFAAGHAACASVDIDGTAVPCQATAEGDGIVFLPPPVPPLGFTLARPERSRGEGVHAAPGDGAPLVLENSCLRAEVDAATGDLRSLHDRQRDAPVLAPDTRGNRLVFYADRTRLANYEPWYIGYTGEVLDGGTVEEVRFVEDGPVRARVQTRRRVRLHPDQPDTLLLQDLLLYRGLPWLVVETRGEWWADGVLLKAEFDLAFDFAEVTADMPYGVAVRPAARGTAAFRLGRDAAGEDGLAAGTEVEEPDRPMHKWLDAAAGERGVAFLNDGRYGYDADGRTVRLSLMRAPRHRDGELVGIGPFEPFSYAVMPHGGDWRAAHLPGLGLAYNYPLVAAPLAPPAGAISDWNAGGAASPSPATADPDAIRPTPPPAAASGRGAAGSHPSVWESGGLLAIQPGHVLITAVKQAEDGDSLVVRLYESAGSACTACLRSAVPLAKAGEADLIERPARDSSCQLPEPTRVDVHLGPFEIRTLLLQLRR